MEHRQDEGSQREPVARPGPDPIDVIVPGMVGDIRRSTIGARRDIDHWHLDVEFDLIVRGAATYALDDTVYVAKPGTLMWMVPGQRHKLTRSPGLEMWVVIFRRSLLEASWLADLAAQPSRILSGHELLSIDRLLSEVAQDSDEAHAYNTGIAYVVMRALRASRDRPPASLKPMHPAVARALMLMREPDNASSLSDLAKAAGIAAPYLSRLLTEHTGRTFVDWRNRIRLDRFLESYRPGVNLLEAALDAGFGSYARFHHVFGEIVGCSPSEWIARAEEKQAVSQPASAPVAGFGVPPAALLSSRERWSAVVPLVSPAIRELLGQKFADRVLAATPREPGELPAAFDNLDTSLSPEDLDRLIASFAAEDPGLVGDYDHLLRNHAFERIHTGVLGAYGLSPRRLTDVVAAMMGVIWALIRNVEATIDEVIAVSRLVEGAWVEDTPKIGAGALRETRVALQCHFVMIFQAAQAVRASGDTRLFERLRAVALDWSYAVFGRDISAGHVTTIGDRLKLERPPLPRTGHLGRSDGSARNARELQRIR